MPPTSTVPPSAVMRRARSAVGACFFVNAVLYANLIPRFPEVKAELGLSNSALGAAIAALPLGALLAGLSSAPLIRRLGSARVASGGLTLLAAAVWAAAAAPNWAALAGALLLAGALDAIVDVAQNAHGLRVQRGYGRSILNAFHGLWSIGAVTGGLIGSAAAGLGIPLPLHLGVVALVFGVPALFGPRVLLPGSDDAERADEGTDAPAPDRAARGAARRTALLAMAALGVLAAAGAFVEDAGGSWSAVYLRDEPGEGEPEQRGGDRGQGEGQTDAGGGQPAAHARHAALPEPVDDAVAGLGVATLVPAVYHAADELPGLRRGLGLAVVNWLLRIGFLVSPLLIGVLADAFSLRVALLTVVFAGLVTMVLGRVLRRSVAHG